jgi:hypothetical protein
MKSVFVLSICGFALSGISTTANSGPIGGGKLEVDDVTSLIADLDRDGRAETFEVSDNGESLTTLIIKRPGKATIIARDMVWSLELASLKLAANGSIQLRSSHIGVGSRPHEQTLTIAYRGGTYQVVGITRGEWDRHDTNNSTGCDINFMTGRRAFGRRVLPDAWVRPVTDWKWDGDLPAGCFIP